MTEFREHATNLLSAILALVIGLLFVGAPFYGVHLNNEVAIVVMVGFMWLFAFIEPERTDAEIQLLGIGFMVALLFWYLPNFVTSILFGLAMGQYALYNVWWDTKSFTLVQKAQSKLYKVESYHRDAPNEVAKPHTPSPNPTVQAPKPLPEPPKQSAPPAAQPAKKSFIPATWDDVVYGNCTADTFVWQMLNHHYDYAEHFARQLRVALGSDPEVVSTGFQNLGLGATAANIVAGNLVSGDQSKVAKTLVHQAFEKHQRAILVSYLEILLKAKERGKTQTPKAAPAQDLTLEEVFGVTKSDTVDTHPRRPAGLDEAIATSQKPRPNNKSDKRRDRGSGKPGKN